MSLTKILVGDNQFGGSTGHLFIESFSERYSEQLHGCEVKYVSDPTYFLGEAKEGNYDVLLIDLNWENADFSRTRDKTGLRILAAVRNYAPRRVLWTSDADKYREEALSRGATACIDKKVSPEEFTRAIGIND